MVKIDWKKLTPEQRDQLESMLRVNQAGELGAVRIYQGQLAVLGRTAEGPLLRHMLAQEREHHAYFNRMVAENQVRPTALQPFWHIAGVALGASTALLGKEAAMTCTEAVETVIGEHYNDQIRALMEMDKDGNEYSELRKVIKQFRDEELEHLDTAVQNDAQKAPMHSALSTLIQGGCRAAIWISSRI